MADSNFPVSPRVLVIRYPILVKPLFNHDPIKNFLPSGLVVDV